ncbi:chromosome partitioning ATPase [Streptomyces olivaceus]|uniref:ParA family protein n=1 Tax=Streptomyces olivaceus TaxID=47716 RepID=UPI0022EF99E9|nr:ParA family protein [Streptomyces olivaceus]GHI98153.1 chromosome partitioning ATPase [Streptomyces olivaceus]
MPQRRNKRVAAGSNKGGVGKTGWVEMVAAALAEMDRRVLVVDVDPQANLSRRVGRPYRKEAPIVTVSEVVKANESGCAADAIIPCGWGGIYAERIDIIPSRFDLDNRISEAAVMGARQRLARALEGVDDDYDFTLFDCQPSLGHLTQLALAAADYGVALVEPEYDGVDGAVRFRDFINDEINRMEMGNLDLRFAAAIPSLVDGRLAAHTHHLGTLPGIFGEEMIWEPIPLRSVVKDAADEAQPLSAQGSRATEMREVYKASAERMIKELV